MTSPVEQVQKAQHLLDDLRNVLHVSEHILPGAAGQTADFGAPGALLADLAKVQQQLDAMRERATQTDAVAVVALEDAAEALDRMDRNDLAPMAAAQTVRVGVAFPEWMTTLAGLEPDVIDPGLARTQPCLRTELGEGLSLVFQRGVLGPLNTEQQGLYCAQGYTDLALTDEQRTRLRQIKTIAGTCGTRFGTTGSGDGPTEGEAPSVEGYFSCVGQELLAQGL